VTSAADVVALTIAGFLPRQVMHLQQILLDFPSSPDADSKCGGSHPSRRDPTTT
jgi:hypothetical protein